MAQDGDRRKKPIEPLPPVGFGALCGELERSSFCLSLGLSSFCGRFLGSHVRKP